MSWHQILWSLEAAGYTFRDVNTFCNMTGILAVKVSVKFQTDMIMLALNLTTLRLHKLLQ